MTFSQDTSTTPARPGRDRALVRVLFFAFAVPLVFALFTRHAWEDYYITFRSSKNLAEGHGLVFQIGERLHTFTSPLGVLLPALLSWLTRSDEATLWLFRVINCAAFSGAAGLMWTTLRIHGAGPAARWIALLLFLSNTAAVDFTINGMETGLLLFFAMLAFSEMARPGGMRSLPLGAALAGLMWTRPDAFIPGGALLLGVLIFVRPAGNRLDAKSLGETGRALAWATVLYGPWIAWAWWYYGSPVPHTILAKAGSAPALALPGYLFTAPFNYLTGASNMDWLFAPIYYGLGGWPAGLIHLCETMAVAAGFLWVFPKVNRLGRAASLMVFAGSFYLQAIPIFPWYAPVWTLGAVIALGCGSDAVLSALKPEGPGRRLFRSALAVILLVQAATLALGAWQMRQQQTIIENGSRRSIGRWLARHARPDDTVVLECLGYIGYFSQLRMLDYPGLSSRAVVEARRAHRLTLVGMIGYFKPDWIVLRHDEYWFSRNAGALNDYDIAGAWGARDRIDAVAFLPGRQYLDYDAILVVLKRKPDLAPVPPS